MTETRNRRDLPDNREMEARRNLPHGRRKKKRKRISGLPIIIILILTLALLILGASYFYMNGNRLSLPGEWTREIDISDYAIKEAETYLQTAAYGDEVDVSKYIADVKVVSELTVTKDGIITERISKDSYDRAAALCMAGLEEAVRELIGKRIENTYIATDMSVDELVKETFNISLSDYLAEYGPTLIPDFTELENEYGRDVTYEATRDSMTITYSDGNVADCSYAVAHGMLVIDYKDGAAIYYEGGK